MEYTKGEWKKEGNKIKVFGSGTIAICPSPTNDEGAMEFVANAHLIASAPELYEAWKLMMISFKDPGNFTKREKAQDAGESALAKAEQK